MMLLAAALAASLEVRHVSVPRGTDGGAVRIECPAAQTTRIVFPDRFVSVKASAGSQEALGLLPEASRPKGILRVTPPTHPAQGRVRVNAPSGSLVVILQTVPTGRGSEIRLTMATPAPGVTSGQTAVAVPKPTEPTSGEVARTEAKRQADPGPASEKPGEAASGETPLVEAPQASAGGPPETGPAVTTEGEASVVASAPIAAVVPSPRPGIAFDASDLLRATPLRIGRREGRPGQREMVLDDALKGESSVWLRFTLKKGAKRQVTRVWWSEGEVESFSHEPSSEDLKLVVQLPRASVKRDSKLNVAVSSEGEYRFALKDSSFLSLFKSLFY